MSRDVVRRELADIGNLVDESKVFAKATIVANSVAYTDLCTVTQVCSDQICRNALSVRSL
jgi:hypothetical protein